MTFRARISYQIDDDDLKPVAKPKPTPYAQRKCGRCTHANGDHRDVVNGAPFCYVCMDSPCHIPESVRLEMRKAEREAIKVEKKLSNGAKRPPGAVPHPHRHNGGHKAKRTDPGKTGKKLPIGPFGKK